MKLNLKDEPKEWRKSALVLLVALAIFNSLLRWRQHLRSQTWLMILAVLGVVAVMTVAKPKIFRPYHLFSMRLGFAISKGLGRVFLTVFFIFILTPVGWILRIAGKDLLQLKCLEKVETYWQPIKKCGPLDRLF